jgi:hypothetical protein
MASQGAARSAAANPSGPAWEGPPAVFGPPDADAITRLAQQFFAAWPGQAPPAATLDPQAAPPLSAAPEPAPQGEFAALSIVPYAPPTSGFLPPTEESARPWPASAEGFNGPNSSAVGSPSPPAAFAQPAVPDFRAAPASAAGAAGVPAAGAAAAPTGINEFHPELIPAPAAAGETHAPAPLGGAASATPALYFLEEAESSPWRQPPALDFDSYRFLDPFAQENLNANPAAKP